MATMDYQTIEYSEGEFDIVIPLEKVVAFEDLLFQQVDLLLETWAGEFVYDITQGMPYEEILEKSFDLTSIESVYYDRIKELVYFKDLQDFAIDIDLDRNYLISFVVVAQNDATQNFNFSLGV